MYVCWLTGNLHFFSLGVIKCRYSRSFVFGGDSGFSAPEYVVYSVHGRSTVTCPKFDRFYRCYYTTHSSMYKQSVWWRTGITERSQDDVEWDPGAVGLFAWHGQRPWRDDSYLGTDDAVARVRNRMLSYSSTIVTVATSIPVLAVFPLWIDICDINPILRSTSWQPVELSPVGL